MNHGEPNPTPAALHEEDRDLAMVQASLNLYVELYDQHCKCDGVCTCPHQLEDE